MFGVVMWASAKKGTAIVLCDDQDKLAFVSGPSIYGNSLPPKIGDVVEIAVRDHGQLRLCTDLRTVTTHNSVDGAVYRRAGSVRGNLPIDTRRQSNSTILLSADA